MKKLFTIALLCTAFCRSGGQTINVSTGVNAGGGTIAVGANASPWLLSASPYGATSSIVTNGIPGIWQLTPVAGTNAMWINQSVNIGTQIPGLYTFERGFAVPATAAGFVYNISVAYDDTLVSLELVPPVGAAIPLTVTPTTTYHLSVPNTGMVSSPTGNWAIRARIRYIDNIGGFMLSGNITLKRDSTVYCCPGTNLIRNGNFEAGNALFASQYAYQSAATPNAVLPGQYNVVNRPQALGISPLWNVEDHTKCINGTNARFLVVNGRTTQPIGSSRIIWQQVVPVTPDKEYKLCANFKNMPQCTFDVKPQVRFEVNGVFGAWTTISTAAGMCNWQLLSQCFRANGQTAVIRIHLREDGLGDGNDLAIDDIGLIEKLNPNLNISVQHQASPRVVTASVNSLSPADDQLLNDVCKLADRYYWFVYEVSGFPSLSIVPNTFAWSSNTGGFNSQLPGSSITPGWALTTTFPGYTFAGNKLYVVGLYVPSCCESCYTDGFTYQLTASFGFRQSGPQPQMTVAQQEQIKAMFVKGQTGMPAATVARPPMLYPNPAGDQLNISTGREMQLLQVIAADGTVRMEERGKNPLRLNIVQLTPGLYTVKMVFTNGETASERFVKE